MSKSSGKASVVISSQSSKEKPTAILSRPSKEAQKPSSSIERVVEDRNSPSKTSRTNGTGAKDPPSSSPRKAESGTRYPTAILQSPGRYQSEKLPSHSKSDGSTQKYNESYGVVFSLKPNFGFIQPLYDEEQIFFPAKEFFDGIKIGDRVGYISKTSPKGDFAEKLRHLAQLSDVILSGIKGVVTRTVEGHRSGFGLVEIEVSTLPAESSIVLESLGCVRRKSNSSTSASSAAVSYPEVIFRTADLLSGQKSRRIDKGDFVEFNLAQVGSNSTLLQAIAIRVLQTKSERAVANQIQRMLDAGAVREVGSVCSIKRGGDFGFIKTLTRKEEVFFKLDDVVDNSATVTEGTDVEFFVIAESNKGKLSDRAIHLKILPPGTVKFEVTVAKKVTATVVQNCETLPEESPGTLRLLTPISIKEITDVEDSELREVELWQRCLPEDLTCKVGDVVTLDVHYYKPEKLYFARSVRIKHYRNLGRETGRIIALKEHGFGFVYSSSRNTDIYFKSNLVVGPSGTFVSESALKVDAIVSFEVAVESTSSGGKFRAQRVLLESNTDRSTILKDVRGLVIRTTKGSAPGLIKIAPEQASELSGAKSYDPELFQALTEFSELPQWKKVSIVGAPTVTLRSISAILDAGVISGVTYDVKIFDDNDPGLGKVINIEKIAEEDYEKWLAGVKAKTKPSGSKEKDGESSKQKESALAAKDTIQFLKEDYVSEEFGSIGNDLTVLFDICWDSNKGRQIARNIRLTDEPINGNEKQFGVIDVAIDKSGGKFGFIRCLESDEKLYWYLSPAMVASLKAKGKSSENPLPLHVGSEVSFTLRRRGGLRCAAEIELIEQGSLFKEVESPYVCIGIVLDKNEILLTDVSKSPDFNRKYVDLKLLSDLMAVSKDQKCSGDSKTSALWEKIGSSASSNTPPVQSVASGVSAANIEEEFPSDSVVDLDGKEKGTESSGFQVEYKPKYFPCIPRKAIPLSTASDSSYAVGTVVNCLLTVNWLLQRSPLHASIVSPKIDSKAIKKKGRIVRLKFRAKPPAENADGSATTSSSTPSGPAAELFSVYNLSAVDFVEIYDLEDRSKVADASNSTIGPLYYCDMREVVVPPLSSDEREGLQYGDEVEFWSVPSLGNIAFSPSLVSKSNSTDYAGIQFTKRPGVNVDLKLKEKTAVIVMAKGPPNESAVGFESGWKAAFSGDVSTSTSPLPWIHLLK